METPAVTEMSVEEVLGGLALVLVANVRQKAALGHDRLSGQIASDSHPAFLAAQAILNGNTDEAVAALDTLDPRILAYAADFADSLPAPL